jgi:hypothetical protein
MSQPVQTRTEATICVQAHETRFSPSSSYTLSVIDIYPLRSSDILTTINWWSLESYTPRPTFFLYDGGIRCRVPVSSAMSFWDGLGCVVVVCPLFCLRGSAISHPWGRGGFPNFIFPPVLSCAVSIILSCCQWGHCQLINRDVVGWDNQLSSRTHLTVVDLFCFCSYIIPHTLEFPVY